MQEAQFNHQVGKIPEKEMATRCSTSFAWEIPRMEQAGGLQSLVAKESSTFVGAQACTIPVYLQLSRNDNKGNLVSPLIPDNSRVHTGIENPEY